MSQGEGLERAPSGRRLRKDFEEGKHVIEEETLASGKG